MAIKQTYLITGAAGFVGSNLSEALVSEGYCVIGIDNFDPYYPAALKRANIVNLQQAPDFTFIEGDIRDTESLREVFSIHRPDVVVHLAARAGIRGSVSDALVYTDLNVMGTASLLSAVADSDIERFVFGSSSSVYGASTDVPFREDQPITKPESPYAASKVAGEAYCHTYHRLYNLPVVCLRFFTVFGPRQRPDLAINKFVRLMLNDEPIPVYGDGTASRDFTFVGDIVRGIIAAAQHPALGAPDSFEIFNLGNDGPLTVLDLVREIEQATGKRAQIRWEPPSPGDVPRTWANIDKAKQVLGWQPEVTMAEGLRAFVEWYLRQARATSVA